MKNMKRLFTVILVTVVTVMMLSAAGNALSPASALPPQQTTPTPTPEPIEIGPANPTPPPTPPVPTKNPPPGGGTIGGTPVAPPKLSPPPTLEDLLKQFPDLVPYLEKAKDLNIGDQAQLAELYSKLIDIYRGSGATGVAVFIKDSGILDKLNIPVGYLDLLTVYDQGGVEAVERLARARKLINDQREIVGYLAIDDEANLAAVRAGLERLGTSVYDYLPETEEVEIGIPLDLLAQYQTPGSLLGYFALIGNTQHVVGFRLPTPAVTSRVNLQDGLKTVGAQTIGADKWHEAGITGKGVRIGVLDGGFRGINELLGSALPAEVQANFDLADADSHSMDHGTAVAMVVHGIAPEAELYLAIYDSTSTKSLNSALNWLAQNKVQVINHSASFLIGPRDGTSPISTAITKYVADTGVLWVNSAGNYALRHSRFEFNPDEKGVHFFDEDANLMPFQPFTSDPVVIMNWNGNWSGGEKNEYIFVVLDKDGKEVATANEPRRGRKNAFPFQAISFEAEPEEIYYLLIAKTRGDKSKATLDFFLPNSALPEWAAVPAYSVGQPGDADAALTVGATNLEGSELEVYSSQGPTNDERLKPDVSGPTGEQLPGFEDGFFGTSGSAPLVAGAAGLVFQAFPEISAAEVKAYLTSNVIALGDESPSPEYGTGRLALPDPSTLDVDNPNPGKKDPQRSNEPSATVTDVKTKFNVRVKNQRGIQIAVSFELDNFQGKQVAVLALFFDQNGDVIDPQVEDYAFLVDEDVATVGTGIIVKVKAKQTAFKDVPLFVPNAAFGGLKRGQRLQYFIGVLDYTNPKKPALLARTDPVELVVK